MSKESEIFVREMFKYFKENHLTGRYLHYYPPEDFSVLLVPLASFLKEMQYVTYDSRKATVFMITKKGQIYDLNEILLFNDKHSEDIRIIGVGNEIQAVNHDYGVQ